MTEKQRIRALERELKKTLNRVEELEQSLKSVWMCINKMLPDAYEGV